MQRKIYNFVVAYGQQSPLVKLPEGYRRKRRPERSGLLVTASRHANKRERIRPLPSSTHQQNIEIQEDADT